MKDTTKENLLATIAGVGTAIVSYIGFGYAVREQGMCIAMPDLTPSNAPASGIAAIEATVTGVAAGGLVKVLMMGKRLKIKSPTKSTHN